MNFQDYTKLFMDYCKNRKNLNSKKESKVKKLFFTVF